MILESHAELMATLRKVFTVYAAFWITALVVLFFATGILLKRAEKSGHKPGSGSGAHH